MLHRAYWSLSLALFLAIAATPDMYAGVKGDRVQIGKSIIVEENEEARDLVCVGCSIHVAGTARDVVAVGGNISIDGTARGDVVAVGGGVRLGENADVSGDVVTIGGGLSRHPNAVVKGEVTSQSGSLILLGLVFVPLIPVILIIALIVWLVGRSRQPVPRRV